MKIPKDDSRREVVFWSTECAGEVGEFVRRVAFGVGARSLPPVRKRAMSLRLIDEHEKRRWPARIGNSGLF